MCRFPHIFLKLFWRTAAIKTTTTAIISRDGYNSGSTRLHQHWGAAFRAISLAFRGAESNCDDDDDDTNKKKHSIIVCWAMRGAAAHFDQSLETCLWNVSVSRLSSPRLRKQSTKLSTALLIDSKMYRNNDWICQLLNLDTVVFALALFSSRERLLCRPSLSLSLPSLRRISRLQHQENANGSSVYVNLR